MNGDLNAWLGQVPWGPIGIVAVAALLWFLSSMGGKKKKAALASKLADGAYVIDVRTKGEYAGGHYPGAVNLPLDTLSSHTKKLGAADRSIVVYCASGGRSAQAATLLRSAGFTNVTDAGGLNNLPR